MEIADMIKKAIQELIVPELDHIKAENAEIKAALQVTNRRLDDITVHLADQSRRIDETNKRIDETNKRIDETKDELIKRIDHTRDELIKMNIETNKRIDHTRDELIKMIAHTRGELIKMMSDTNRRIDETNRRMDRLYEVIVRREEHERLESRISKLEHDVAGIKVTIAA